MPTSDLPQISAIFGEVLRRHRVARDISQEELAHLAGVDRTFVSRLERGIRQPTITTLIGIGKALDVSAADMVREAEKEYLKQAGTAHPAQAGQVKETRKRYSRAKQR